MTIAREGTGFRADCTLNLGSGVHVSSEANSHDAYTCVDAAIERLGRQLSRQATKAKDHGGPPAPQADEPEPVLPKVQRV